MSVLAERRTQALRRVQELKERLEANRAAFGDDTGVYVTGSLGRGEASAHSDLDIFIIRDGEPFSTDSTQRQNKLLAAIANELGFPPFAPKEELPVHHTIDRLVANIGSADDDAKNTFTSRLLLLLESQPLFGEDVYWKAVKSIVAAYFRDYEEHEKDFVPTYLVNDIVRIWRTFCLNYEARTEKMPNEKRNKRKLKNYKLKNSRLLTCYSGLLALLGIYERNGTVKPEDVLDLVKESPTMRLEALAREMPAVAADVQRVLAQYEQFLQDTAAPEAELLSRMSQEGRSAVLRGDGIADEIYGLLTTVGGNNVLHRRIVV